MYILRYFKNLNMTFFVDDYAYIDDTEIYETFYSSVNTKIKSFLLNGSSSGVQNTRYYNLKHSFKSLLSCSFIYKVVQDLTVY